MQPHHGNIGRRLVKSPKVYVRDSGLVHSPLGIKSLDQLAGHPVYGASWEGFVLETLLAHLPWRTVPLFYRTAASAEINFLIEHGGDKIWTIEIKRSLSAKITRGFYQAVEDLKPERAFVVYAGREHYYRCNP